MYIPNVAEVCIPETFLPVYQATWCHEPHMKAHHYEKHELQNSTSRLKILSLVILIATSDFGPKEAFSM
jgi:hypothetical protein